MKSSYGKRGSIFNLRVKNIWRKNDSLIWLHKTDLIMVVVAQVSDVAYGLIVF